MKRCPKCKLEIENWVIRCPHCGADTRATCEVIKIDASLDEGREPVFPDAYPIYGMPEKENG